MKNLIFILFAFVVYNSFAQETNEAHVRNNRLSIHTGVVHYFFDGEAPIRFGSTFPKDMHPHPISRVLQSSFGAEFKRRLGPKGMIHAEVNYFYYKYSHFVQNQPVSVEELPEGVMRDRQFFGFGLGYTRIFALNDVINFSAGCGVLARQGEATFAEPTLNFFNMRTIKLHTQAGWRYGANLRFGMDYNPFSWLTMSAGIDFNTMLFPKNNKPLISSRFDAAFRLGVGYNF
jgi:hypothetical protein